MKRIFSIIGCSVLLVFLPLSSVWAVWEGNAGIAAATEFPGSGLYAKSDMFPKNTVVEITNLETEITVRAIITGTSGVPGLVAVLSPETAAALNIRTGSVSRVRISVPSVVEKPARGTATESTRTTIADPDINPAYLRPKQFMNRLQKIMDEYAGGVSTQLSTSKAQLEKGLELLAFLREDANKLGAESLNELMRCWENRHRLLQAEAHMRSVLFRDETRWPGYYVRTDKPAMDQQNWLAFCNTKYNRDTNEWTMVKRPVKYLTRDSER